MEHDPRKDSLAKNGTANLTRRGLFELAGLAVAAAVLKPELAMATQSETPKTAAPGISPVMEKLSSYMSEAAARALPEDVVEKAKQHVLDTFAAMISGSELPPGRAALEFARAYGGKEVATALASGEQFAATGAHFLRAVTLGYDIGTRVTMSMGGPAYQALTHRSTHGTAASFAAAAASGCLAGLNATQMRFLLDYAAQQTSGIGAWSRDAEHMEKAFLFGGKPAAAAVTAAMLIRSGWTGVDDIFSGPDNFFEALAPREGGVLKADPAILVDKLGERYEITRTNIKKWTVGSPIQAPLDALAGFFHQRSFTAEDVTKVVVRIASDEANTVSNRDMPDICMEHMVAIMLLDKTASFRSVHDKARMKDPGVLRQRAKVQVIADPRIDARRPRREAIVELTLADGTQLTQWVKDVRGTAENPMTRDEVAAKARDLIAPVLGATAAAFLIEKVLALESVKDLRDLRRLLQR